MVGNRTGQPGCVAEGLHRPPVARLPKQCHTPQRPRPPYVPARPYLTTSRTSLPHHLAHVPTSPPHARPYLTTSRTSLPHHFTRVPTSPPHLFTPHTSPLTTTTTIIATTTTIIAAASLRHIKSLELLVQSFLAFQDRGCRLLLTCMGSLLGKLSEIWNSQTLRTETLTIWNSQTHRDT